MSRPNERYLVRSLMPGSLTFRKGRERAEILVEDVSTHGAGMTMYQEPTVGEKVTLKFKLAGKTIEVTAQIRWAKANGPKQWSAGCKFDKPLKGGSLACDQLGSIPERRLASCAAVMRRESSPDHPYPVEIRNCSGKGIGVVTSERFGPGESVLLEVGTLNVVARMEWTDSRAGEILVGCTFQNPDDAVRVQQAMGLVDSINPCLRGPILGASFSVVGGTIVAALIVFLTGDGLPPF